jgi:hypothetical protein
LDVDWAGRQFFDAKKSCSDLCENESPDRPARASQPRCATSGTWRPLLNRTSRLRQSAPNQPLRPALPGCPQSVILAVENAMLLALAELRLAKKSPDEKGDDTGAASTVITYELMPTKEEGEDGLPAMGVPARRRVR